MLHRCRTNPECLSQEGSAGGGDFQRKEGGTVREGYRSVPETAEVTSTGNVLPSPASKELKGSWRPSLTCVPLRFGNSPATAALRVPPAPCQGPGQGQSLCPGVPLSSSPSLISREKPSGNAPLEQTGSPSSNRRDFDPHKVQDFSLPQSSPWSRLGLPGQLLVFHCLGVFLVLTAWSSLTGAAPRGLQPHQHCAAFAALLGIRGASLHALGHDTACSTLPPLFIGAYFQIFPNYFISEQSTLSASISN